MTQRSLVTVHHANRRRSFGRLSLAVLMLSVPVFLAAWISDGNPGEKLSGRVEVLPLPQDTYWLCRQSGGDACEAQDLVAGYGLERPEAAAVACGVRSRATRNGSYDPEKPVVLSTWKECPETGELRCRGRLRDGC